MIRCIGYHPDATEDDPAPDATVGYLCATCFSRLRSSLLELPAVATWLEVNIAAGGSAGEKVSGTREDPIPLRTDVLDLIGPDSRAHIAEAAPLVMLWEDGLHIGTFTTWGGGVLARWQEVVESPDLDADPHRWQVRVTERGGCDQRGADSLRATIAHWCRLVVEEGPFAPPARDDLAALVAWLAGHLSWVAGQPWVDELAEEIRKVSGSAHRLAPWRADVMRDEQPCTTCGVKAVMLHVAESTLRCEPRMGGCGKVTVSDYLRRATA